MVAVIVAAHPAHARALHAFQRLSASKRNELFMCAHSLAELFAVLTRMPTSPRIGPDLAKRLVNENIEQANIRILSLDVTDYLAVLDQMAEAGLMGGIVYDMLILQAAQIAKVDRVLTLNESDFSRLPKETSVDIAAP